MIDKLERKSDTKRVCNTCGQGGGDRYSCSKCEHAYHEKCVPPGTAFNYLELICPDHDGLRPSEEFHRENLSENSTFIVNNNGENEIIVTSSNESYLELRIPATKRFKLDKNFHEHYVSSPDGYKEISNLQYRVVVPKYSSEECIICTCCGHCGSSCMNASTKMECVEANNDGTKNGDDRYQTCQIAGDCGNRKFQKGTTTNLEVIVESGRGWGIKTLDDIPAGELISEYVGEVIDEEEMQKRLSTCANPSDHNHYVMELDDRHYIDAKYKGNKARFINHSCSPNCEIQKWRVGGYERLGVFSLRDIAAGESLSYDYKFYTRNATQFKCNCDAALCRGTMAPVKKLPKRHRKALRKEPHLKSKKINIDAVQPEREKIKRPAPRDRSQVQKHKRQNGVSTVGIDYFRSAHQELSETERY